MVLVDQTHGRRKDVLQAFTGRLEQALIFGHLHGKGVEVLMCNYVSLKRLVIQRKNGARSSRASVSRLCGIFASLLHVQMHASLTQRGLCETYFTRQLFFEVHHRRAPLVMGCHARTLS